MGGDEENWLKEQSDLQVVMGKMGEVGKRCRAGLCRRGFSFEITEGLFLRGWSRRSRFFLFLENDF